MLFLLLGAAFAARADEPVAAVPYRIDYGGWFTLSVTVNGEGPFDFIVDTGATQSLVFQNLDDRLHFPASGGPPQTVLGLAAAGKFPTFRIDEITVGQARFPNLVTVKLQPWTVAERAPYGVLGLDFLERYFVVFDRKRMEMRLYDNSEALEVAGRGWRSTDFTRRAFTLDRGSLHTIEGYANNRLMRFIVDLGATGTIINDHALARIARTGSFAISVNPASRRSASRVVDALNAKSLQRAVRIDRFRTGRVNWYNQIFVVFDALIFEELGVRQEAYGLLGADLFHDRSIALDFKGEKFWIGPEG